MKVIFILTDISDFRGGAIFMYVPETNFVEPQALLESGDGFFFL